MKEKRGFSTNGWGMIVLLPFTLLALGIIAFVGVNNDLPALVVLDVILFIFIISIYFAGFYSVEPNETKVLMFAGKYIGTDRTNGFRWTVGWFGKQTISTKINEFETNVIKVNDINGNPIELSAIVLWKVKDTAQAIFNVEHYVNFIVSQSESSLRKVASKFAYDSDNENQMSLIHHPDEINHILIDTLNEIIKDSGMEIIDMRINHLSYAKEIASAMLQRQQAQAIISARKLIVEGAVSMVEMAINELDSKNIVKFNDDNKQRMVGNLLTVLCSDQGSQSVVDISN